MKKKRSNPWVFVLELLFVIGVAIGAAALLRQYVISKDVVVGVSMAPTLNNDDRLFSLRTVGIKRNAIVVVNAPDRPNQRYVKRVIGLPGDTVESKNDVLYINGKRQAQPYLKPKFMQPEIKTWAAQRNVNASVVHFTGDFNIATLPSTHSKTVPAGHYFVLGDNRLVSHDSRDFGFLSRSQIESVIIWRYAPIDQMQWY
ncbi:signal peptidase I [Lacticaseibacillus brantae]|uniref:signal peptidase I n=1 Tax=Lacticaseibacillus brantae TaxID=943673 RepID=UPI000A8C0169